MFIAPANPQKATLELIEQCREVLDLSPHPLGCRAIYYRLVGTAFPKPKGKGEADSKTNSIERAIKIARDLELVRWESIVDNTRRPTIWSQYLNVGEWVDEVIDSFAFSPWPDQPKYVEAFVEAEGLKGHFDAGMARYWINVEYGRGNSSWTALHRMAKRIETSVEKYGLGGAESIVLTFGDLNPSGQNISECVREAMEKWCNLFVDIRRVCLLPDDLDRYSLHGKTYPVDYANDTKAAGWTGECCELDAMSDDQIAKRIREEAEKVIELTAMAATKARTATTETRIATTIKGAAL